MEILVLPAGVWQLSRRYVKQNEIFNAPYIKAFDELFHKDPASPAFKLLENTQGPLSMNQKWMLLAFMRVWPPLSTDLDTYAT